MPKASKARANTLTTQSDSFSLILPYLYVGPCSATSTKSSFIVEQGITHIISVGRKPQSTLDSITYLRLSIEDDPSADLRKAGGEATAFINKALAGKKESCKIFVHCSAGISRSPATVAFYLMQSCGMSLKQALGLILRARPIACPNPGFMSQLQQVELECRGSSSLPPELTTLPRKKEERLALFHEDQPHGVVQPSSPTPILDSESLYIGKKRDKHLDIIQPTRPIPILDNKSGIRRKPEKRLDIVQPTHSIPILDSKSLGIRKKQGKPPRR